MKTRIRIAALLMIALSWGIKAKAQVWQKYADLPANVFPVDIVSNDSGYLFMLTKGSQVYWKSPAGNWKKMKMSAYGGLLNAPCISVEKGSNRLYVGSESLGLFYTSDFGNTWGNSFFTTNPVSGFHESAHSITEIANPNLFFALSTQGGEGSLTKYTNRGTSGQFITYTTDIQAFPETIHYTANGKLLVGTFNKGIWRSDNNGGTTNITAFNQNKVFKFTEDNTGGVYALTYNHSTGLTSVIYSTDYQNWTTVAAAPSNTEQYTTLFYERTTNMLWLGSQTAIYKANGASSTISWQNANFNNTNPYTVEITNDHHGKIICATAQHIVQELAANNTWSSLVNGLSGEADLMTMTHNGKLVTTNRYLSNMLSILQSPTNNWNNMLFDDVPGIHYMDVTPQGTLYCRAIRKIYRSTDNGATFSPTTLPPAISSFPALGTTTMYVGKKNGLFLTQGFLSSEVYGSFDMGNTWAFYKDFGSGNPVVAFEQDTAGTLYALIDLLSSHQLQYSTDNGASWITITDPALDNLSGPQMISKGNRTFIVASRSNIITVIEVTLSGASPFRDIPLPAAPIANGEGCYGLQIDSAGNMYVCFNNIYKSTNSGLTWTMINWMPGMIDAQNKPSNFYISANGTPYVIVTNGDGTKPTSVYWYTTTPLSTGDLHHTESYVRIFPNPTGKMLHYSIASKYPIIGTSLTITNLQGRNVLQKELTQENGEVNIEQLPAGIYMAQFHKGVASQIIKFVKQ